MLGASHSLSRYWPVSRRCLTVSEKAQSSSKGISRNGLTIATATRNSARTTVRLIPGDSSAPCPAFTGSSADTMMESDSRAEFRQPRGKRNALCNRDCSMSPLVIREAAELDLPAMAELRETSGWKGGASAERMRLYLRGEHHPQFAEGPRAAFLAKDGERLVGFIAGHLTKRFGCD